jgi:hypothetical protein
MKGFDFLKYLIRVAKYMVYLAVVFFLIIAIFSVFSNREISYGNLFQAGTETQMIVFFLAVSFVYPLIGFVKKKVYLNKGFSDDKQKITEVFLNSKYVIVAEGPSTITFRHSSPFVRAMRMFEDDIVIDYSDNPIVLDGQRRDVFRLARSIEYVIREEKDQIDS